MNTASESASFQYGPDRQRWQTVYTGSVGTETTYHVGRLLEKVANGGALDYRHYIFAGNELVGIFSRQNSGANTMRYTLDDHQASVANIVSSTGAPYVNESFTAYGNRRGGETWSGMPSTADENSINAVSRQGYTGQTALGVSMGLNHMNGRIQDAITGRFLSPDPYVPEPGNTQSYNRYSYVNNNPLSFIDPTGFDDLSITVTCCSSSGGGGGGIIGDIFSAIGSFFGGLFGGGGPQLSPSQQLAQAHGINRSTQLPEQTVIGHTGVQFADNTIASQFYSPFTTSAIASVLGVQPSRVVTQVTTTPSQSPDELDQINVTATGSHAFDWFDLAPGYSAFKCFYYGCGSIDGTLAAIGAIPIGSVESAGGRFIAGAAGRAARVGSLTPGGLRVSQEAAMRLAGRLAGELSLQGVDEAVNGAQAFTDLSNGTIRYFNSSITQFGGEGLNVVVNPATNNIVTLFPSGSEFIGNTSRFIPLGP